MMTKKTTKKNSGPKIKQRGTWRMEGDVDGAMPWDQKTYDEMADACEVFTKEFKAFLESSKGYKAVKDWKARHKWFDWTCRIDLDLHGGSKMTYNAPSLGTPRGWR